MPTFGEDFSREQARVRELLAVYRDLPAGAFGAAMIEDVLKQADESAMSGDLTAMLRAYNAMKECE